MAIVIPSAAILDTITVPEIPVPVIVAPTDIPVLGASITIVAVLTPPSSVEVVVGAALGRVVKAGAVVGHGAGLERRASRRVAVGSVVVLHVLACSAASLASLRPRHGTLSVAAAVQCAV